jgi:iron(III) transport system ATP-binding protein
MIKVSALTKSYSKDSVKAVNGIDFEVPTGTILTLLGPSGCGKTTTLRCVAGLERADEGEIDLFGDTVFSAAQNIAVHPSKRQVGMIFQSYAIWPHMTVFQNVAYPLKGKKMGRDEMRRRAMEAISLVNLEGMEDRPAPKLSGGQQQRVALARAIAGDPKIFLLDEPLSNLDAKLREEMRGQIRTLQRKLGITSLYVTHDQIEALSISDQIAIMDCGEILELGTPRDIYLHPKSQFAAQFIGLTNIIPAKWMGRENEDQARLKAPFAQLICDRASELSSEAGSRAIVLIRPENVELSPQPHPSGTNVWKGHVTSSNFLGEYIDCTILCGETEIRARVNPFLAAEDGTELYLHVPPERCSLIPDSGV